MEEINIDHILLYLACEHMMIGIIQLQEYTWVSQPKREWCRMAKQPIKELCRGVGQLPIKEFCVGVRQLLVEDLCVGLRHLQLGVRHLRMEDICVVIRQLQLEYVNWS